MNKLTCQIKRDQIGEKYEHEQYELNGHVAYLREFGVSRFHEHAPQVDRLLSKGPNFSLNPNTLGTRHCKEEHSRDQLGLHQKQTKLTTTCALEWRLTCTLLH